MVHSALAGNCPNIASTEAMAYSFDSVEPIKLRELISERFSLQISLVT